MAYILGLIASTSNKYLTGEFTGKKWLHNNIFHDLNAVQWGSNQLTKLQL